MDEPENQNRIYMLEFMVDKITLGYCAREEFKNITGQMCVAFSFMGHGPFNVCEEDFTPKRRNYTDLCPNPSFKNGKSCVFTLMDDKAQVLTEYFNLELEVFKKLDPCCIPDRVMVGNLGICLNPMFTQLWDKMKENPEVKMQCQAHMDVFPVYGACNNEIIGELTAFLRMTCFGKMVVNDFQMDMVTRQLGLRDEGGYVFQFETQHDEDGKC